jgi:beta-glucosidase
MSVTARASLSATAATTPWAGDLTITVSCTVTNTGDRRGKEVVQLYVADLHAQVPRPVRELKAFAKITLEPGQAATVTFPLEARDLSYWSTTHHCGVLEAGGFQLAVGASSRDLRLTATLDVPAPPLPVRLDAMATLQETRSSSRSSGTSRSAAWPPFPASVSTTPPSPTWSGASTRRQALLSERLGY